MKKQLVVILAGWCLATPLWAQPPALPRVAQTDDASTSEAALEFLNLVASGNERGVLLLAQQKPREARIILQQLLKSRADMKTPDEVAQYKLCVTLLARGLELGGDPSAMQQIRKRKEVDVRAAKLTLQTAGSGTVSETNTQMQAALQLLKPAQAALVMVELGNFAQLPAFLDALVAELKAVTGAQSLDPSAVEQLQLAALQARMIGGDYLLARTEGEAMLKRVRALKDQEDLVSTYVNLIAAARLGAMPDLVQRYLPVLRQELARFQHPHRPLYQLALYTWEAETAWRKNPNVSPADVARRFEQAWAPITSFHVQKSGDSYIFNDNVRFWYHEGLQAALVAKNQKQTRVAQQLSESLMRVLNDSQRLAKEEVAKGGLGMMLGFALNTVELHTEMLDLGMVKEASETLKMFAVDQLDVIDQGIVAMQAEIWQQLPPSFLQRLPAGMSLDLRQGTYALLRERFARGQLRQLLADHPDGLPPAARAEAQKVALEGLKWNQEAIKGLGYQGLFDIRWVVLDYLAREKPADWERDSNQLLAQLQAQSQATNHRPATARALMLQGELLAAQGKVDEAIQALQNGVQSVESYVSDVGGGQLGADAIRKNYKRGYDLLTRLLIQTGRSEQALNTLARQQQLETTQLNQQALASSSESVARLQALRGQGDALQQQYAAKASLGMPTAAVEKLIAQNKAEFHQVLGDLRRSNPEYEQRLAIRPVNFSKLQSGIPEDTTVVQYFPSKDALYIFVATSKELKIRQISVREEELDKLVKQTRQLITSVPLDPEVSRNFSWKDDGSRVYQRHTARLKNNLAALHNHLIAPVLPDLGERKVLAIIPTGTLHYVPYPALCQLGPDGMPKFLAEQYQCVNIVTVADLARVAGPPAAKRPTVFAMGNPDGSLPGAEREVKKISEFFPKAQSVIGPKATADQLRKIPPQTTYVHLATHGHLDSKVPTRSYLVVAGEGDKGRFEVGEIYGLPLEGVRLVTLSACETAIESQQPGSEVTNLAEAFSVAGGNSVLASLWSVSDEGTEALMTEFYRSLAQQKPLAEALQQAEVNVMKQSKLSHPFYWASFTLFGDWR